MGVLGFAFMAGAEWANHNEVRFLKPILWFGMPPIFTFAVIMAWVDNEYFSFPSILSVIAWFPFILFSGLFIYSAYVEIPLKKTYIDPSQPTKVVTNGTYSLCRHPAALWFIGWIASAIFISRSVTLVIAAPVWISAYIGCIFLEEKLCCLGVLSYNYKRYRETTPMLIPTYTSIERFWRDTRSRFNRNDNMRKRQLP